MKSQICTLRIAIWWSILEEHLPTKTPSCLSFKSKYDISSNQYSILRSATSNKQCYRWWINSVPISDTSSLIQTSPIPSTSSPASPQKLEDSFTLKLSVKISFDAHSRTCPSSSWWANMVSAKLAWTTWSIPWILSRRTSPFTKTIGFVWRLVFIREIWAECIT